MVPTRLTLRFGTERHDISGEPDLKPGGKEMQNHPDANNMMMIERMLQEQCAMSEIAAELERLIQRNGQFKGKDVSRYLRDYKVEMLRCGISEGLQVTSFNRVAINELQESIHGIRQQNPTCEAFEEALKTAFSIEDSSKATWRGFEDWVETPDKGLKVVDVFSPSESRFGRLSARDQAILVPNMVIMFVRAVDIQYEKHLGVLLEDTTTEWLTSEEKRDWNRFRNRGLESLRSRRESMQLRWNSCSRRWRI